MFHRAYDDLDLLLLAERYRITLKGVGECEGEGILHFVLGGFIGIQKIVSVGNLGDCFSFVSREQIKIKICR